MRANFSEFSFGYALTESLVDNRQQFVRPIFPTLRQEQKFGYDLKLEQPGFSLFLQFKLCEGMSKRSAMEISYYKLDEESNPLHTPFLRMPLMAAKLSPQHERLRELDSSGEQVYYATPRFYKDSDFARHYRSGLILEKTAFIRPNIIGALPDEEEHYVSFEAASNFGWFLSEPLLIQPIICGEEIRVSIKKRLTIVPPVRISLVESLRNIIFSILVDNDLMGETRSLSFINLLSEVDSYMSSIDGFQECFYDIVRQRQRITSLAALDEDIAIFRDRWNLWAKNTIERETDEKNYYNIIDFLGGISEIYYGLSPVLVQDTDNED